MAAKKKCDSIALFYKLNHKKGKSYTFHLFKNCGLSRKGIYNILARFDERGNVDRKSGSGRFCPIRKADQDGKRSLTKK